MIGQTSNLMAMGDPDIRLMLRIREDDQTAFSELVERYQSRLLLTLHHLMGNNDEAEDLAQEVFLRVYRSRKSYTPTARFSTWIFTIANNVAFNAMRKRQSRPKPIQNSSDSDAMKSRPEEQLVESREGTPSQAMRRHELTDQIRQALESLNERQRMAVILNKFEEMPYAEIAQVMGISEKAVKSLLNRARCRLREVLQHYIYMESEIPPEVQNSDSEFAD